MHNRHAITRIFGTGMKLYIVPILILIAPLFFLSCKKDSFITGGEATIAVSADTLHYDTVFTSTGSVTQFFRIYNTNNQKLRLSSVQLSGGASSWFKINVDGTPGPEVRDIEIAANDSIYVFVSVKIDPTLDNLPFIVQDSIRIVYNGNERWVQLDAWGQNAHFMRNRRIESDEVWENDKPYVILGGIQVDTNVTLTIKEGCRIYLHADAPFIVDGTLQVEGDYYDSTRVVFRGDRLDDPYRDFPASWPGIYFREESRDNVLRYAIIKNAYQGVVAVGPSPTANPKLTLEQCIIDNCYDAGLFGLASAIEASNCLVSNCGKGVILAYGGDYDFTHCTVVSYGNSYIQHKEPVLVVTDYIEQNNTVHTNTLAAYFRNCIFWGENGIVDNEVVTVRKGTLPFVADFRHCLWKIKDDPAHVTASTMITNEAPLFDSTDNQRLVYNFRLQEGSPAVDQGMATSLTVDLDGQTRVVNLPDIGCYERQD
jgi:hypothetical protein